MRRTPKIPWATAVLVRPEMQERTAEANTVSDNPAPELRLELPPFPSHLITVRSAPSRPRVSGAPSGANGIDSDKLELPMIAPQLTQQESTVAQQETNQSLEIAEKNLESARGKKLDAGQLDLVSKISGFIKDAREAAQIKNWSRARSLAKKAQFLSEELAGSL